MLKCRGESLHRMQQGERKAEGKEPAPSSCSISGALLLHNYSSLQKDGNDTWWVVRRHH